MSSFWCILQALASLKMGYDVERFVGTVNDGLLCCICRDVLEDPLQAPCEHAYCTTCIHGWLVHDEICPEDRQPLTQDQLRPIFRYMKNDLNQLRLHCSNQAAGCCDEVNLEMLMRHEARCGFGRVACPNTNCGMELERRTLDLHLLVCQHRTKTCPRGCGLTVLNSELDLHNCVAELRTELELLLSEMIGKNEDQKHEMKLRLDSQRTHMVHKISEMQQQMDELKSKIKFGWTKKDLRERDLNLRPPDWRAGALPTELTSPILVVSLFCQYLFFGGASQKPFNHILGCRGRAV